MTFDTVDRRGEVSNDLEVCQQHSKPPACCLVLTKVHAVKVDVLAIELKCKAKAHVATIKGKGKGSLQHVHGRPPFCCMRPDSPFPTVKHLCTDLLGDGLV